MVAVDPELVSLGAAGLDDYEAERRQRSNRTFVLARAGWIVALGGLLQLFPLGAEPGPRLALTAVLWFVVLPVSLLVGRQLPDAQVNVFHTTTDLAVACVAAFVVPQLWYVALVIVAGAIVSTIPIQPRAEMVGALILPPILVLATAGHLHAVPDWPVGLMVLVAPIATYVAYYRATQRHHDALRLRYDSLITGSSVFFWEFDLRAGRLVTVAGDVASLLGYRPAELLEMPWEDAIAAEDLELMAGLAGLRPNTELAINGRLRHADGRRLAFRHVARRDHSWIIRGVSADINELVEATATIRYQAEHDALTDLANRDVLVGRLAEAVRHAGDDDPVAILVMDLDRFSDINDSLGLPVGDRVLQILAHRLTDLLGEADLVARLGSDEFAVLLVGREGAGPVTRSAAMDAARRMMAAVEQQFQIDRLSLSVGGSIGVALSPDHGTTVDALLRHAEMARYEAKRSGEPVRLYDAGPADLALERLNLSTMISSALDENQFELFFQPKVDLATGAVVGAEGLARWRHPERGVLAPGEFLELISLAGEYHRFTDMVLAQGMAAAAMWARAGFELDVAVNLSSLSFFDQRLPDRLAEELARHRVAPHRLTLELTESDILDDSGHHGEVFTRLRQIGVGISIDDFGTGHSSLVRLRELPVTEVKLDRSFVSQVTVEDEDRIIVQTVVDLANALGLRTVAEGIEDQATADAIRTIGCTWGQGYHWARPLPLHEFNALLTSAKGVGPGRGRTAGAVGPVAPAQGVASPRQTVHSSSNDRASAAARSSLR